jgi:virulence-associated protein VagC
METPVNEINVKTGVLSRIKRRGDLVYIEVPPGMQMDASAVTVEKDGDRLIITPLPQPRNFRELLEQMEPAEVEFPDVDAGMLPSEDVNL